MQQLFIKQLLHTRHDPGTEAIATSDIPGSPLPESTASTGGLRQEPISVSEATRKVTRVRARARARARAENKPGARRKC